MSGSNRGHSIIRYTSTGGTIPTTARSLNDFLVKTTVYALCVAIVFVLLVGVGSAANNTAPVANDDTDTTSEDTPVTTTVLSNDSDPDGDTLTVTAVTDPANGAAVINGDYTVTYTPDANFNGVDSYVYTISDGNGGTDTATVTISVGAANDAPVANDDTDTTSEDTPVTTDVLANDSDVDGDTLTVTSVTSPSNGVAVINGDNTVTYTPDGNFNGGDSYTYTISDGNGGTDTATVTITVSAFNDAPVANDDVDSTAEDTSVTTNVVSNDSDIDGNSLSVTAVTQPANGVVTNNNDGTVTYTPNENFNGADSYTYTISDDNGGTDTATVTITVGAFNDAPVAVDDVDSTAEDTSVTTNVVSNDSDIDGNSLSVTAVTQPANGVVTNNNDGTVTYTPNENFNGADSYTYTISDGNGGTDTATVTITVGAFNDAPVANDDVDSTAEDTSVTTNVVSNDSDIDGDTLSVTAVTQPANGVVTNNNDGTVTYTPNENFNGDDTYTYTVSDGNGGINTATVTITVDVANDAPVLNPISNIAINEMESATIELIASDVDVDSLTYSAIGLPTDATLNSSTGVFAWTPTYEQAGTYHVKFEVTDGLLEDSENVTITVNDVNRAPILDPITGIQINETETATIVLGAFDPDGDTIAYSTTATFGVLTNNTFNWTSGYDDDGIYYLEFTVSDGDLTDTEIGVIVVGDADRAPVLEYIGPKSVNENSILSFTLNASDADEDTLTYSAVDLPNGSTLNSSNGLFKWIPDYTQAGTYHVKFEVTDGLLQDSENVTITVNDVNTAVTPPSSGGGGGGGGGSTGEEFDNIEVRDVIRVYINKDSTIIYEFKEELNAIDFVKFDAKTSAGYIAATIEVLKDTSALVSTPPSGEVYQNMNIWVGNAGYATEDKITNPTIEFKVARTWIAENNINQYKIQLCRYSSGVWEQLPTTKKYEDVKYIYFTSNTSGFSSFAITGIKSSNFMANTMALNMPEKDTPTTYFSTPSTSTDDTINSDEMEGEIDVPYEETKSSRGLIFILSSIGIVAIIIFMYRRRDSSWDMP